MLTLKIHSYYTIILLSKTTGSGPQGAGDNDYLAAMNKRKPSCKKTDKNNVTLRLDTNICNKKCFKRM